MSKENKAPYLNKKTKKKGMKETLIYGTGNSLKERENADKKYKKNKLNE
jgi:hypothetical protein